MTDANESDDDLAEPNRLPDSVDVPDEGTTTITRPCRELAGCGGEIEVEVDEDGDYEGGIYFGDIEVLTEESELITERTVEDEWVGPLPRTEWTNTKTVEFWMHDECATPNVDPNEVDRTVT